MAPSCTAKIDLPWLDSNPGDYTTGYANLAMNLVNEFGARDENGVSETVEQQLYIGQLAPATGGWTNYQFNDGSLVDIFGNTFDIKYLLLLAWWVPSTEEDSSTPFGVEVRSYPSGASPWSQYWSNTTGEHYWPGQGFLWMHPQSDDSPGANLDSASIGDGLSLQSIGSGAHNINLIVFGEQVIP